MAITKQDVLDYNKIFMDQTKKEERIAAKLKQLKENSNSEKIKIISCEKEFYIDKNQLANCFYPNLFENSKPNSRKLFFYS